MTLVKIQKQVQGLENALETIEARIMTLDDRIDHLEEVSWEKDLTDVQQEKLESYTEQKEALEQEQSDIEDALDYIREYGQYDLE